MFIFFLIKKNLGPYTLASTLTQSIDSQFQQTSVAFSSSLKNVYSSSQSVSENAVDISSTLNSSTEQIRSIFNSLISYESQIDSTLSMPDDYFTKINYAFYAAWSLNILAAIFGLLGAVGVYLLKWSRLRMLLHCSWCLMSLLMIMGFTLASIFVPLGIMTLEGCDLYQGMITSQKEYSNYVELIPGDVNAKLQTCLFGTGDLSTEFGIRDQIDQMNEIQSSLNNLNNLSNNSNFSIANSNILIDTWHSKTDSFKNGILMDSSATDDNNSFTSIESLNKWADYSTSGSQQAITCSITQDNWVFNSTQCNYPTTWITNNSPTDLLGSKVCMQIQDFDSSGAKTRYDGLDMSCSSTVSQSNIKYFNSLKNYDNSRRILFANIGTALDNLKTKNDQYNNKLLKFNSTVYGFSNNINTFINHVSNPVTGFANGFNCKFLKISAENSYNSMCVSLFIPIYLQLIFICTTSMLMFFMSLLAYLAGMRFGAIHKQNDVNTWGGSKN